jgi:hypothetical protein
MPAILMPLDAAGEAQVRRERRLLERRGYPSRIPNARLRRALTEATATGGLTVTQIAQRMGLVTDGKPDTSRVKRMVGLMPLQSAGAGKPGKISNTIRYRDAVALCRALGRDPHELDI